MSWSGKASKVAPRSSLPLLHRYRPATRIIAATGCLFCWMTRDTAWLNWEERNHERLYNRRVVAAESTVVGQYHPRRLGDVPGIVRPLVDRFRAGGVGAAGGRTRVSSVLF